MTRQRLIFPDLDSAVGFTKDVMDSINDDGSLDWEGIQDSGTRAFHDPLRRAHSISSSGQTSFPLGFFDEKMSRFGGWRHSSHQGRELFLYGNQDRVRAEDRLYLYKRDTLVRGLIDKPAHDTWSKLPATNEPDIDDFFHQLQSKGFNEHAIAADILNRRDGGGFLYINASGNISEPLTQSDVWHGFDHLTIFDVVPDGVTYDPNPTPLTRMHGIEEVEFFPKLSERVETPRDIDDEENIVIHGSRLVPFVSDPVSRWWFGESKIDACFDDLVDLRDTIYAQRNAQLQGDPFAVTMDTEQMFFASEDVEQEIEDAVIDFESGHRDSFTILQGVTISRVGGQDLEDPEPLIQSLAGRIAMNWELTGAEIAALSTGDRVLEPEDRRAYVNNIERRQETFALPILRHMLTLGQRGMKGPNPKKRLELREVEWPELQSLGERDQAVADNRDIQTLQMAAALGREAPRQERKFPEAEDGPNEDAQALSDPRLAPGQRQAIREMIREELQRPEFEVVDDG